MKSTLLHGDAIELLPKLSTSLFRLVLTDPPYEISRPNNWTTMKRRGIDFGEWDQDFDQFTWISLVAPLLVPAGSIVIFNDWKKLGSIASHAEKEGFVIKDFITYQKTNPIPGNKSRRFAPATEHGFWAVKKDRAKWVFNKRPCLPYETGVFSYGIPGKHKLEKERHPTKKPLGLFSDLIEILSNPGDWVLDPFSGSATTALAAKKLKRKYICIEKDKNYYETSARVLANERV